MSIISGTTEQTIASTSMNYVKGRPEDARYGACYYEITAQDISEEDRKMILGQDNNKIAI